MLSFPKTLEDNLIHNYWEQKQGSLFLEVPIGNDKDIWPKGSKTRRIDAIRVLDGNNKIHTPLNPKIFKKIIKDKDIELIEAKKKLNRLVYGQIIAGIDMFKKQYNCKNIKGVILCTKGDPAMEIICEERDIEVNITNS